MGAVERAKSLCRMYYFHGEIADMNTPISSSTPRLPADSKL